MRLVLLCGLFFASKAAAQCPQVPLAGLLPNEAVQDCGSATSEGVVCPFNCSNAFSHTGHLRCLSGTWQVDSNDPPRCIQPCYSETLITGYGQRAAFLGYLNGFWASPTEAITTTTLLSCDVLGAQSCLQTVVGITDIQEFCSRLPGATTCLKAAECCESSAATIRSSINSCADVGRVVENPCVDSTGERCSSECIPPTLGSDATAENCAALRRVPFCMRSQSCCNYWLQGLGLAELAVSCRQLGIDISDACEGDQLPYVSNEGAQVQVTCQTPRYASSTASMVQNYTCQNSSFHLTPAVPALQCLDPPCPLDPHPSGSYECTLDGQSITLSVANGVLQVPFGASCTLRCSQSHELPVPPETLQCVYVESDFTNIIYADSSLVTSTGVPRMVRRFTNSSLVPAVQQVCEAMDCPLPVLQQPVALNGNIYQAGSEIDGVLYVDCNGISHGSSCSPVCAVGFTVDPLRPSLRCDVGRFQGHVRCVQQRCAGAPVWGFGGVGSLATWPSPCANALHGETCEVSCASGYMRDPNAASYICEAGEWTAPATSPCVESSCAKAPVVSNAAALQACANRPHGYECPVRCNSGYTQLGSVRCNKGSYLASGLVCIPQGIDEELQTESVDAIRAQILFVKTPRLVSLQGRVHVAANAALALEPHLEPQQLATKLAGELDVSAPDLSLALSTLPSVLPSFALRAALAAAPEVSSIVILAMARFEALDLWSNISHVLVAQGSTALRGFSAALAPFATAPAAAMAALARDAGDVLQRDLDLQRFFQLLGVGSAAAIATAERQFNLTDGMDSTELQNLRLSVLGSFRDLPGAVDMADFHSKFTAALSELDLEDTLSSSTAAAAAAAVAVRQVVPTAMEDVTAAAAMVTVQQMRSACVGTPSSCQRETSIALLEAGREGAKVAEWRPGALAEVAAAALQASSLTMLAGALSVFGVRKEDLQRLMPSAGLEEIESAFWLSQVQDPRSFLELMQRYPVSGIDLAFRLAENGAQVTPMEGEFALSWTGDLVAAPLLRARLAGASGPDLSAAYLAALQVPPSSRSPSLLASTVSSALPSNLEAVQRCIITRAVAVALGLNATLAAKAAVLAAGFNQTTYAQSLAAATSDDIQIFAEQVRAYAGTESEAFQELSLAFAVALEKFNDVTTALLVVLQVVETPSSVAAVSFGSLSSFVASASEFVSALLTWLWSKGHAESHMLLGHFMWLLGENASGPIFQSALLNAGVYLFEADELLDASFDFSRDNSWLSLAAQRAVEEWQADGQSDLAAKVRAHLQLGSSQQSLVHAAGAAHFAAVYAGMNITATAHRVFATLGQEASPSAAFAAGFWAQKWPARPTDLLESAAATMAVVESYQQGNLEICPANETRCPNATSQHGCAERVGLTQGFSCHSHCSARSSVTWPRRCIGFVLGDQCQAQLGSCNYTITQQDLSSHSSGLCVCSSIMDSVHAAADNANRLARLTAELQSLHFLSPKAHRTIAPMDVIAAAQALTPTNRSDVLAAVLEIISRREAKLTPQQVAYAAYSVAALQGLNRSEAALAAVEVSTLDEDENLAPLAEVLFFQGMDLAEAKALVVDTAERLPRVSAKALRQAFWHFQQLQDSSRQLVRSRIMDDFEGGPAFSAYRDAQAFQGLQVATAHAISAGAEAQQMLSYHMASGYSYKQALKLLGAEGNITEELTLAGQRLTEQLAVPAVQSVDSSWFQSTGSFDAGLFADEAYILYIQESLASALAISPVQVDVVGFNALLLQLLPSNIVDLAIKLQQGDDAAALSQQLQNFSSVYGQFDSKLREVLAGSNLPVPGFFSEPQVAAKHLQVVSNFQVPVAKWLASSAWSTCPAVCGKAWQFRDVKCSGNVFACDAAGPKLAFEQTCEAYLDCPFEWTCPLGGRDASMACGVQFLLAAGILIFSVIFFWLLVQFVRHYCRCRPRTGELRLIAKGGQSMKVNFYIVEQLNEGPRGEFRRQQLGAEKEGFDMMKTVTNQEEQKTKVVWDIDVEKAQRLEFQQWKMQSIGGQLTNKQERALKRLPGNGNVARRNAAELLQQHEQEAEIQRAETQKSQATTPRSVASPRTPASQSAWSQSTQGDAVAPYRPNACVEYFSMSQARWMPAELRSTYSEGGYDVMITSNRGRSTQLRKEIPLQQLRALILEGESVSAFWNGEWCRGHVLSKSTLSNSYVGYSVKVAQNGKEMVLQTQNVWRRFPKDTTVRVFDDSLGWLSATVTNEAEMMEPLPGKDAMPTWFEVEVVYETGEEDKVPGYRVKREVMTL